MQIRRCATVFLEPREEAGFDLGVLLSGGDGLHREVRWLALAPHRGEELEIDAVEREILGGISPSTWVDGEQLAAHSAAAVQRLVSEGLLISDAAEHVQWRRRDEAFREVHWHPLAATLEWCRRRAERQGQRH
jgi:hypothetical protein